MISTEILILSKRPKSDLLQRTNHLAAEERRIGVELLWHLSEIDRRRLSEELGFSGIFDYCVKVLKLSEGSAYRRVQAMRALQHTPDLAEAIKDGRLNVTTASQIQSFLQKAKRSGISSRELEDRLAQSRTKARVKNQGESGLPNESVKNSELGPKKNLFEAFENFSRRDIEKELAELAPEIPREERERLVGESEVEVRVTISTQTRTKWSRIQALAAHRLRFDTSTRRLIELTTDVTLEALEKEKGLGKTANSESEARKEPNSALSDPLVSASSAPAPAVTARPPSRSPLRTPLQPSRLIPTALRKTVWRRDEGRCRYHDPESGKRCESRFGLEIDHIRPWSQGGSSYDLENLRLLCGSHHRLVTEKTFGSFRKT